MSTSLSLNSSTIACKQTFNNDWCHAKVISWAYAVSVLIAMMRNKATEPVKDSTKV